MKLIFRYMKKHLRFIVLAMVIKLMATLTELLLPTILEHIIDEVVPLGEIGSVLFWGVMMFVTAVLCRQLNVTANRKAIAVVMLFPMFFSIKSPLHFAVTAYSVKG